MIREELKTRIETLVERGEIFGVASVYLFGSAARNTSHRESDIDLGFLLDWETHSTSKERFDQRLRIIALLEPIAGASVDVVILNDVPATLGRAIVTRGERTFCFDAAVDHDWTRDVQLKAADLDPFLERMRRIKLEVLTQ